MIHAPPPTGRLEERSVDVDLGRVFSRVTSHEALTLNLRSSERTRP